MKKSILSSCMRTTIQKSWFSSTLPHQCIISSKTPWSVPVLPLHFDSILANAQSLPAMQRMSSSYLFSSQTSSANFLSSSACSSSASVPSADEIVPFPPLSLRIHQNVSYDDNLSSGSILWNCSLHTLSALRRWPRMFAEWVTGPVLELGCGTGALGIGVERMQNWLFHQSFNSSSKPVPRVLLTDHFDVISLTQANIVENNSAASVEAFDWGNVDDFLTSLSCNNSMGTHAYFQSVLCSDLVDLVPSGANSFRDPHHNLAMLVRALLRIAQHSLSTQESLYAQESVSSNRLSKNQLTPNVTILFAFEDRGSFDCTMLRREFFDFFLRDGFSIYFIDEEPFFAPSFPSTNAGPIVSKLIDSDGRPSRCAILRKQSKLFDDNN